MVAEIIPWTRVDTALWRGGEEGEVCSSLEAKLTHVLVCVPLSATLLAESSRNLAE